MTISLFYWYTDIKDVSGMVDRMRDLGELLKLGGRIRVSSEGMNGTVGGSDDAVDEFQNAVVQEFGGAEIDFKISEGGAEHFGHTLQVRKTREVVTLGESESARRAIWRNAAPHLTPLSFRDEILQSKQQDDCNNVVIVDVRNGYETDIGRFDNAITPDTRQFAEFPKFVKRNRHIFENKRVLMYCTGGVRCERGSALIKQETQAKSVAQLRGGIDAFLKTFPDGGGVFKGRNLVFDQRIVADKDTPPAGGVTLGQCICCGEPWDDYSGEMRCQYCRRRVLLCDGDLCKQWRIAPENGSSPILCNGCKQSRIRQ